MAANVEINRCAWTVTRKGEGRRFVTKGPHSLKSFAAAKQSQFPAAISPHDLVRADRIGGEQNDLSLPNVFLCSVAIFDESLELPPIAGETDLDFPVRIAQTRTRRKKRESKKGTQPSDFIPQLC